MYLKNLIPEVRISKMEMREYKDFIASRKRGKLLYATHIINIIKKYICFTYTQKRNSYIYIYYNAADYPILTINYK